MKRGQRKPKCLTLEDVSSFKMAAGNEKKFRKVIFDGRVKEWVGIGWIDEGVPSARQLRELPTVEDA